MKHYYIGLMSGTSVDGIDAALVDFGGKKPALIATSYTPYSPLMREKILALCERGPDEIERLGELDHLLGKALADTVQQLLKQAALSSEHIKAIGSHGQTIRHRPHQVHSFTLQIGDPNLIAATTGITTVADFRRKDMALGGQGAPLVPAFHQFLFADKKMNRAIINIGGMANVTLLSKKASAPLLGFDTGPGNTLLDAWIHTHRKETHDVRGEWGAQGHLQIDLLDLMLADPYFHLSAPKSTGREYFNLHWLNSMLHQLNRHVHAVDVQATLVELTAQSIIHAIQKTFTEGELIICGGGTHNLFLMTRLKALATPHFTVNTTETYGIHPDWVEAVAFAWLAQQTLHQKPGNLPSVTGATCQAVLGGVYFGA